MDFFCCLKLDQGLFGILMDFSCSQFGKKTRETTRKIAWHSMDSGAHQPPSNCKCCRGTLSTLRAVRAIIAQHAGAFPGVLQANTSHDWFLTRSTWCVVDQTKVLATSSLASIRKGDISSKTGDELESEIQAHWVIGLSVRYS